MKIRLTEEEKVLELDLGINHDEFLSLFSQAENHMKSASYGDAIVVLEKRIEIVKRSSRYSDDEFLPWVVYQDLCKLAKCHVNLYRQKQWKSCFDLENKSFPQDEKIDNTNLPLELLCEHHCWTPGCMFSGGRRCAEDADESHQPECPTEFFPKRRIESGGGNLNHLETALAFLTEALDLANYLARSSGDTLQVANVHIFLPNLHLLEAEHKCGPLMNSDPLLQITPEILNTNDCHTIQQVREFLQLNGISPEKSLN